MPSQTNAWKTVAVILSVKSLMRKPERKKPILPEMEVIIVLSLKLLLFG